MLQFGFVCGNELQGVDVVERTGAKVTDIAKAVGFHRATIYNELKRGGTPYRAEVAQRSL